MKPLFLLLLLLYGINAGAQLFYNENYYTFASQSREQNYLYVRWYNFRLDTAYKEKKLFLDSAGTKLVSKSFYHQGQMDGPYEGYDISKIIVSGSYKNGKPDGDRHRYLNDKLIEKAKFILGRKAGTWEEYDVFNGRLRRRTVYNDLLGTIISDVFFQ